MDEILQFLSSTQIFSRSAKFLLLSSLTRVRVRDYALRRNKNEMPRAGIDNYLQVRSSYWSWYRVESTRQYYFIPIEAVTSPLND